MQALKGIRVLDLSAGIAGPHTGMLLAQHGAQVIKVEPLEGDWGRRLGTHLNGQSAYSLYYNQGKQSLALDLKHPRSREILERLLPTVDIFIESFRPGVIGRLGLGYAQVAALNPRIIYLSVSAFGQTGALAHLPGTDSAMQAYTGLMYLNRGADGTPQRFPYILIDVVAGLYGYNMVSSALIGLLRGGTGTHLDCSLMHVSLALQGAALTKHQFDRVEPPENPVPVAALRTLDGHVMVSISRDEQFQRLCACAGLDALAQDARYATNAARNANEASLLDILQRTFAQADSATWCERLVKADVVHGRVNDYDTLLGSAQLHEAHLLARVQVPELGQWLSLPTAPLGYVADVSAAPALGQHTVQCLRDLQFAQPQIEELLAARAVQQA